MGIVKKGRFMDVVEVMDEMEENGVEPNDVINRDSKVIVGRNVQGNEEGWVGVLGVLK